MSKYPEIEVKLVGQDGNAFTILGRVTEALRRGLRSNPYCLDSQTIKQKIANYQTEATSGDYSNLIATTMNYVSIC